MENTMTHYKKSLAAAAGLLFSLSALAGINGPAGPATDDVAVGSLPGTTGLSLCTAAVNSDGTLAGKNRAKSSALLSTGSYEVLFNDVCGNVSAAAGWSRWVQVDTLSSGSINNGATCTTADRSGAKNGIFVFCTDATGVAVNTSFFLFVAR
jgi:hypothetical protein